MCLDSILPRWFPPLDSYRSKTMLRRLISCNVRILFLVASCLGCAISMTACDSSTTGTLGEAAFNGQSNDNNSPLAAPSAAEAQTQTIARDIEEADVVKVVDDRVYVLNRFKGLIIIDISSPDAPKVLGEYSLNGRGVEMYVVDDRVFAILSADYYIYAGGLPGFAAGSSSGAAEGDFAPVPPTHEPPAPEFDGSQLAIIDVSDPTDPTLDSKINLAGYASQSRRVGDVIYVIGANIIPYSQIGVTSTDSIDDFKDAFVASINIADPANPDPVDHRTFTAAQTAMHVSDTTIFASGYHYDSDSGDVSTIIQTIDISDPAGAIVVRGSFDVPGTIRNRFFMDDYQGVFRVATESAGFGFGQVRLFTYDLADLDNVLPLGQTQIMENESLEAVRFDGPRGYAVTFFRTDPLFVLDLSDPANPVVSGHLEVPGFSTHIEPRGDRLIAVGIDDTDGNRPAVAYYDVSDPANPTQLGRVILGPPGSYTESEATYDEKAFKIVDELNLIAIPFRHVDYQFQPLPVEPVLLNGDQPDSSPPSGGSSGSPSSSEIQMPDCTNAVQLVDFSDSGLTQRGYFEHRGRVERVGMAGDRVFALSQVSFQTVNITDRDAPASTGKADFFTDDEMPNYADDCGYGYYGGIPIDNGGVFVGGDEFASMVSSIMQNCGAAGLLPLMATIVGMMGLTRPIRRNRIRRKGHTEATGRN
jgi:hypothetical protein